MHGHRPEDRRGGRAQAEPRRAVLRARLQDHVRPVRRQADVLPRLLRRAQGRLARLQPGHGPQGARRAHPPDARQQPRGARVGRRRRDRRRRRASSRSRPATRCATRRTRSCSSRSRSPSPSSDWPSSPRRRPTRTSSRNALGRLSEEDPTFRVRTDDETGQVVISGMGELHLEIIVDRLVREFSVAANVGKPQVAYRETDPQEGREGAGQVRAPDRRPRPVRRRRHLARAEPGQGLRVRQQDHGRRDPEGVHQVGRRGHPRGDGVRHGRRLPRRRRQGRR